MEPKLFSLPDDDSQLPSVWIDSRRPTGRTASSNAIKADSPSLFLLRRGRFKPWFLNICHRTATERMDGTGKLSAKKWRRSFAPSLAHPKDHKPSLMRTQVIYVAREMPHEDLWAQLCLYLLQIRVLKEPSKSDLTVQLLSYLKAFRAPPG